MRGHVDIDIEKYQWECDCCGNGDHVRISWAVDGKKTVYSRNDQFGGPLNKETDLEFDFPCDYATEFAEGIKAGLISAGYSAKVKA